MKVKFFSFQNYEENYLNEANLKNHEISFDKMPLSIENADSSTKGFEAISVFTNDDLSAIILQKIKSNGVKYIAIRASGYEHVDLKYASENQQIVANVPAYSPHSVAEHAITLMLALNRKIVLANKKVHEYDFTLTKLTGFDMHGKTIGIIGMGKIGETVAKILHGFGCKIFAHDLIINSSFIEKYGITYCSKEELFASADIITLHCPLNNLTRYFLNKQSVALMKKGVMIINCGRGGLINTDDIIEGLKSGKIGYLGIDVYEKEKGLFFFDHSNEVITDNTLLRLMEFENVLITPHQGFLTTTALKNIADTTFYNINCWADGEKSENELTYIS